MAILSKALALATILATFTSAAPLQQKRDLVYETVTQYDVTTIDTTITLYPGEPTPSVDGSYVVTTAVAVTTSSVEKQAPASTSTSASPSVPTSSAADTTSAPPPPTTTAPATTAAPAPAAPEPTTTSSSSTSTSAAPAPSSTSSSGSGSGSGSGSHTGDGTYYITATSMTNPSFCDTANDGTSENVVALSSDIMTSSLCGASITVEYEGKTATGTVVDKCPGCDADSIDMSEHMFGSLTDLGAGRITVSWSLN